jgi:YVTN family beta-propeller protein
MGSSFSSTFIAILTLVISFNSTIFGSKAYVALVDSATVAVYDMATTNPVTSITISMVVDDLINFELASPDTTRVYVAVGTQSGMGFVSVIDVYSDTILTNIPIADYPMWMAITPDQSKLYCLNSGSCTVIETATNSVTSTISVGGGVIAISPNGSRAYVTSGGSVAIIDTTTDMVLNTVSTPDIVNQMVITPDGTKVYMVAIDNLSSSFIDVLDTTNNMVSQIAIASSPYPNFDTTTAIVITPDGSKVYVGNGNLSRSIQVIDVVTDSLVATIPISTQTNNFVQGLTIGSIVYVTSNHNGKDGCLSVVDTGSNTVIQTISLSASSSADNLKIDPEQTQLVVNSSASALLNIVTTYPSLQVFYPPIEDDNSLVVFGLALIPPPPPPNLLFPPSNGEVVRKKCNFLTQSEVSNVIYWNPPNAGEAPATYLIYRDPALTNLVGVVNATSKLEFIDNLTTCKKKNSTYYIVSEDVVGNRSTPLILTQGI